MSSLSTLSSTLNGFTCGWFGEDLGRRATPREAVLVNSWMIYQLPLLFYDRAVKRKRMGRREDSPTKPTPTLYPADCLRPGMCLCKMRKWDSSPFSSYLTQAGFSNTSWSLCCAQDVEEFILFPILPWTMTIKTPLQHTDLFLIKQRNHRTAVTTLSKVKRPVTKYLQFISQMADVLI